MGIIDDMLDFVFTPWTTPIIGFACTAAYYSWIVLTSYTVLTTIPVEHWRTVGLLVVFGWYFGTEWKGWFKRK